MILRPVVRAILIGLLSWLGLAQAAPLDPLALLTEAACWRESRGEYIRAWAVSPSGADWGVCQIRYESAWRYGGFDPAMLASRGRTPSRSPGDLFRPEISRAVARAILADCRRRFPGSGSYRWAYCYTAGPYARPGADAEKHRHALAVSAHYNTLVARALLAETPIAHPAQLARR